jgi:hypothetical protein
VSPRWPTREEWRTAAVLVLATRVAFWLVGWLTQWYLADGAGPIRPGVAHWRRWDADIYVKIAEHGYAGPGAEPWSEAFPPGWPLLLRAAGTLVPPASTTLVALVLATLATIVAVAYLLRLVADERPEDPGAGRRAGLYLLLFPTAVFLVAGYSEALFLAGAIPAFREARRGRWTRVALPAAVAVATRWTGVFLLVGLGVELLRQLAGGTVERSRLLVRGAGALAVGTLPLVAYTAWLAATRGDPLHALTAQREGWGRAFVGPVESFRSTWDTWNAGNPTTLVLSWRLEIVAAAAGILLVRAAPPPRVGLRGLRRHEPRRAAHQ